MGAITLTSVAGKEGSIRIPALGALIGQMASWTLKRRGDDGPKEGLFDLRAALSYVNPHLFNHPEYALKREIRVRINKQLEFRIEGGDKITLDGNSLTMEGVTLCRL
jgi:hypothetical protein